MRTILLTLMLVFTLAACAGKEDAPVTDGTADAPAEEQAQAEAEQPAEDTSVINEELVLDPVGDLKLANGTVLEITKLEKLGDYFIYITGKLNGRSSTIISLTRLDDLRRWKTIVFKDQHTFTIVTRDDRELHFANARIYLGSDSHETYTFHSTPPDAYRSELTTVPKKDVQIINIVPLKTDD